VSFSFPLLNLARLERFAYLEVPSAIAFMVSIDFSTLLTNMLVDKQHVKDVRSGQALADRIVLLFLKIILLYVWRSVHMR